MRRVRHLQYCDYIIAVKQKAGRGLCLSDSIRLERTWHEKSRKLPIARVHARFNADTMDGLNIFTTLSKDNNLLNSIVLSGKLYRVALGSWSMTLIGSLSFTTNDNGVHTANVTQSFLGSNELTGKECYMIETKLRRVRRHYGAKVWFNSLGMFDSLNELRKSVERLEIMKVDE